LKTEKWVRANDDTSTQIPIPKSGGNSQLGGYEASKRPVTNSKGVLLTPRILAKDKSRIKAKPGTPVSNGMPPPISKSGSKVGSAKKRPNEKKSLGSNHI
jgi:hypothetical protein